MIVSSYTKTSPTMSNQSDPLMTFLRDFPVKKGCGNEATLCGLGTKRGSWSIPDEQYPKFLDILSDYLKKGRALGFVEQPRLNQPKPLLIDLDFKFKPEQTLERLYVVSLRFRAIWHHHNPLY